MKRASTRNASTFDFRLLLEERLRTSSQRNSRFSLRSFARQLNINHSTLSQILRGKRRLTASTVTSLGRRLGLPEELIEAYKEHLKMGVVSTDVKTINFDVDTFLMVSVWYHQAILEFTHTKVFRADTRWLAKALGISISEVNVAVQRLLRLGLLEMTRKDRWVDKSGDAQFQSQTLPEAGRRLIDKEIHELAIEAINSTPSDTRVSAQMIFAVDSKKLEKIKQLSDKFLDDVRALSLQDGKADDVYGASVSIFPVTTIKRGE